MFSFFKKKPVPPPAETPAPPTPAAPPPQSLPAVTAPPPVEPGLEPLPEPVPAAAPPAPASTAVGAPPASPAPGSAFGWLRKPFASKESPVAAVPEAPAIAPPVQPLAPPLATPTAVSPAPVPPPIQAPQPPAVADAAPIPAPMAQQPLPPSLASTAAIALPVPPAAPSLPGAEPPAADRKGWFDRLKSGLRKTGSSITTVFTGTRIDDALYEELEEALLLADTGVKATQHLLEDLKRRVKESKTTDPAAVKGLLADALTALLRPLEKSLVIGEHTPTVVMVAGVNGAGKTTSIGKLTRHLANEGASVLLAAADTFRAAAREQLGVWADRNTVEIVSQEGGDPAAVSFDAVTAGKARGKDVVLVDTAGRLPTQLHLMEELKKIRRVVTKADATAPHEVLLVIDGNTGQNALAQVRAFDDALQLTGLVVTKLDGTAKGGVLAAIAQERPIPVYFIGVGEKLEDLETFNAREFAQALLG
ncbi:MAG: signal recognition particle-docking protein FtsY [Burkholderiaceae bacterium]|nr:signal recognition particle-docking protein FtsY [Burkholderiaceae bacterium]